MPKENKTTTNHSPFAFAAGIAVGAVAAAAAYFVSQSAAPQAKVPQESKERGFQATDPTCSICRENIYVTLEKYLSCGHVFHKDCIERWAIRSRTCPTCKARF